MEARIAAPRQSHQTSERRQARLPQVLYRADISPTAKRMPPQTMPNVKTTATYIHTAFAKMTYKEILYELAGFARKYSF